MKQITSGYVIRDNKTNLYVMKSNKTIYPYTQFLECAFIYCDKRYAELDLKQALSNNKITNEDSDHVAVEIKITYEVS